MDTAIRITLLGGVEVSGVDPPLTSRALSLLACLAVRAGTPQPRAHLAALLWPDSAEPQARTNLRRELHHLRTALRGSPSVAVLPDTLAWQDTDSCSVDVATFLALQRQALAALAAGDTATFAGAARQALALYQGPLLPGWYDEWVLSARDGVHRACVELCHQGAAAGEQGGDALLGIELAQLWTVLEPVEESGYRTLGRMQRAAGDRAGAIRTYHRCVDTLERELGVAPSPETEREFDTLLADDSEPVPDRRRAGRSGRVSELVGRDAEHETLLRAWRASRTGARFVLVSGEPGAGKTRLVAALAAAARHQDAVVAPARCFATTGGLPMAPVAEWLRDPRLAAATRRLPEVWQAEVRRLVPEDGDSVADDAPGARPQVDAWRRLRFFEGLARAVLAVERPLLLVLDDLQWSDRATLSWLAFLLRFGRSAPVLVVATAREDELGTGDLAQQLRTMAASGEVTTVSLGPLAAPAAADLARRMAGRDLSAEELDLVHTLTGDNPFYVIEATREADSVEGPLRGADLGAVLAGRLARMSEPAREVLDLASAVGRDFGLDLLTEASDLGPDLVVRHVDELWHRRILDQTGRGYDFAHDLIREAAYAQVEPARRWLLHRRIAQALEELHADHLDAVASDLAEQYDASGQPDRALQFYDRAARQATAVFAHAEAVRLWERALDLVSRLDAGVDRDRRELDLLEQLLPPLNAHRGYADPDLEKYELRCHELGVRLELPQVEASVSMALFATTFVQGRITASSGWAARALRLSESFPSLAGEAHFGAGGADLSLGRTESASEHFEMSCRLSADTDSLLVGARTVVHARAWWGHALWLSGDADAATAAGTEAVAHARALAHPYSLAIALAYAAITQQLSGDRDALAASLEELADLCARFGYAYYRDWEVVLSGWLVGGPAGQARVREGIASLRDSGALTRMPYWLSLLAELQARDGDRGAAVATLDAAAAYAGRSDDVWWLPEVLRLRASLQDGERAARDLRSAERLARAHGSEALLARCRSDLAARGVAVQPAG